jgi:hypothetical protein
LITVFAVETHRIGWLPPLILVEVGVEVSVAERRVQPHVCGRWAYLIGIAAPVGYDVAEVPTQGKELVLRNLLQERKEGTNASHIVPRSFVPVR